MNKMRLEEVIESGDLKEAVKIIEDVGEKLAGIFRAFYMILLLERFGWSGEKNCFIRDHY
ncbi:hypothetical protein JOD82_003125 [Paenibacillus sp. 1182]|uniref:hypothetical protein n=1 Tax=Paenibacillus sp. 1182 TaxID=2806565 RepID=UPI001B53A530|nr:hypothetical protein [Paenibacillus sp. 1182]MBP1310035.1 hypothetical protein [Paenibacillus sp. 1182]